MNYIIKILLLNFLVFIPGCLFINNDYQSSIYPSYIEISDSKEGIDPNFQKNNQSVVSMDIDINHEKTKLDFLDNYEFLEDLAITSDNYINLKPVGNCNLLKTIHIFNDSPVILDYTPLSLCKTLKDVYISDNHISDVEPFSEIENINLLVLLVFNDSNINFDKLSNSNIKTLVLAGTAKYDINSITKLSSLEYLEIDDYILDLNSLNKFSNLNNLKILGIRKSYQQDKFITDVNFISKNTSLEVLNIYDQNISDLNFIDNLNNIKKLTLSGNRISDLSPLSLSSEIEELNISKNLITDLSPLLKLNKLRILEVYSNPLSYKAIYEDIPALEARGVTVYYNKPEDYDPSRIKLPDETNHEPGESD